MDNHTALRDYTKLRDYTAQDIEQFFQKYQRHVTHAIVAHTHMRPYDKSPNQIQLMAKQAKKDCRYALNCFNKLLYPSATNKPVRNPLRYKPLAFVTIEGAKETLDRAKTIHFNITLGNLPKILTTENIDTLFRHAWHDMAQQSTDVKAYDYFVAGNERWMGYILKEAQQEKYKAWAIEGIWDVENCWIPHAALNAD